MNDRYEASDASAFPGCESANLVLPATLRVQLLMTSNDAISVWRVPALEVSVDLVAGRINERLLPCPRAETAFAAGTLQNEMSGRSIAVDAHILHVDDGSLDIRALCGG